jgi:pimeloyl-ACP methyl ester carboxylesterase
LPHDATLVAALKDSACNFDLATGRGYSAMTATPQEALFPEETSQLIVKLLTAGIDEVYSAPRSTAVNGRVPNETSAAGCLESIYRFHRFDTSVSGMFGILAQPEPPVRQSDYCLLYLNAGPVRHTGPNRMWVESARRWAAQGVASLRFDLTGIGESEGEQYLDVPSLYQDRLMDQIKAAIDSLRGLGLRRFVAIGLCSGACWALHSAIRYADVRAAIVLNPSLLSWDAGADRRRMLRDAANGFSHWTDLGRKIRGGMQKGEIRRAAHRVAERLGRRQTSKIRYLELGFETPSMAWSGLERDQKRVTLVFREGEPLLAELEAAGQLPLDSNSLVRCVRVPNGGHTFRPLWAQKLVHEIIDAEIAEILRQEGQTDHRGRSPQAVHV